MSGHATIDTAVEATRIGALDFLEKPIALQKLLKSVEQGLVRGRAGLARALGAAPVPGAAQPLAAPAAAPAPVLASVSVSAAPAVPDAPAPAGATGVTVAVRDLPIDMPLREARDAFERAYFEHHLAREHGSMTRVAEKTGLERTHLYRKLKQLGIDLSRGAYRKG